MSKTLQDVFDAAWDWAIVKRMPRCVTVNSIGEERCAYRGPGGNRCWIGISIPDEKYRQEMENKSPHHLHNVYGLFEWIDCDDLGSLQEIHDDYDSRDGDFTEYAERRLREYADQRGLKIPEAA